LLSQTSLHYFQEAYPGIDAQLPYSMIPNGIDGASFQVKDIRFAEKMDRKLKKNGKITVLCMSRWSWGKGLEYLLDAFPLVAGRYPNVQLVIAGWRLISWENKYWQYLWKIGSKIAALHGHIIPLGWLNDVQRNSLLPYADIWVMPSLLEYFPYSILEPMIAGIPIISSRIDSVAEILRENEECLLYDPENPQQLAEQIIRLIQNPDLRHHLADEACKKAKTLYSWAHISELYLNMYHSVTRKNTVESQTGSSPENS
jgi:glycosyltransferase involved in cell wall biosynthesis